MPVVRLAELREAEARALRLALNRLGEEASWDATELAVEIAEMIELDAEIDLGLTGFETAEIDLLLQAESCDSDETRLWPVDKPPPAVRTGECWTLGDHRLLCGNALDGATLARLMGGEQACLVLTDPPYNLPIQGHVSGLGAARHAEFSMASGEMSGEAFTTFLAQAFTGVRTHLVDGGLLFSFMDWRHVGEMSRAAHQAGLDMLNLIVWAKTNGGMGSLYRSRHELVFVFKSGRAAHVNNVALGRHGRNRSNVWTHAGATAFGRGRDLLLSLHPTVKPVALLADAILDVTHRSDLVLDPFAGVGSTLLAAERTGRRCHAIEIAPGYCDAVLARWQAMTGIAPVLDATGETIGQVVARRAAENEMKGEREKDNE